MLQTYSPVNGLSIIIVGAWKSVWQTRLCREIIAGIVFMEAVPVFMAAQKNLTFSTCDVGLMPVLYSNGDALIPRREVQGSTVWWWLCNCGETAGGKAGQADQWHTEGWACTSWAVCGRLALPDECPNGEKVKIIKQWTHVKTNKYT